MLTLADSTTLELAPWVPTLPFIGMLICGLAGAVRNDLFRKMTGWITVAAIAAGFVITCTMYGAVAPYGEGHGDVEQAAGHVVHYFDWINTGDFSANFSFFIDPLTIVMLMVVTGIGTVIAVYASWYMSGDPGYWRFFAYINLFIFAMTCLVMGDNLLLLYLGWEGVGAASYLLIGFYYRKPSAVAAAKKAFIVNRIGDFGFALGLMGLFAITGSVQFSDIFQNIGADQIGRLPEWKQTLAMWVPFLLMLGAFGKSAQLPLHVWLPDAMEGPTPVSALIHAATMVTAGVYMIARLIPVFMLNAYALPTVAWVGGITALFAATIALCQYDLKRVWAYSTISQLGFMFVGVGVMATYGAVFHLFTHAFFKALLFLTAGSVMHAMAGQLDLRRMSGLFGKMPVTAILTLIGCLALAGVPFTSGFFSKDTILAQALTVQPAIGVLGIVTALLTAFYTFRVWFRVFLGEEHYEMGHEHHGYELEHPPDDHAHGPHESPMWVNLALGVLAIGALGAGFLGDSFIKPMIDGSSAHVSHEAIAHIANLTPEAFEEAEHSNHKLVSILAGGGAIVMILLAGALHWKRRDITENISRHPTVAPVVAFLHAKWKVDELYDAVIRRPLRNVAWVSYRYLDQFLLDRTIIDRVFGGVPRWLGALGRTTQHGSLQGYALSMGVGVVVILLVVAYKVVAG